MMAITVNIHMKRILNVLVIAVWEKKNCRLNSYDCNPVWSSIV